MENVYSNSKHPNLQRGQVVGVVTNYFTEQFLKRDFRTKKLMSDDILEVIEDNRIEVVFIETYIYEEDHSWFGYDFSQIIEEIKKYNVNIIEVNVNDFLPNTHRNAFYRLNLDSTVESIESDADSTTLPLMINEKLINPIDDKKSKDILFVRIGDINEDDEIRKFIKREKPKYDDFTYNEITRNMIKNIISRMKNYRVTYIYFSDQANNTVIKYLALAAVFQNTILILDPDFPKDFRFAFKSPVKESNTNYIQTFMNKGMYTDKYHISHGRKALLSNSLIQYQSLDEVMTGNTNRKHINISVVTCTMRKWAISSLIERLNTQKYVNIELILLTHGFELSDKEKLNFARQANFSLKIISEDKSVIFGLCLNKCIDQITNDYFTKMDDDDYYYPNYLMDSWIAHQYSEAEVVGKHSQFVYLEASDLTIHRFKQHKNRFTTYVAGGTIFCTAEIIKKYMFSAIPKAVDSDILGRIRKDGGKIYCSHPYEFCLFRADDSTSHTWTVPDTYIFRSADILFYDNPSQTLTVE